MAGRVVAWGSALFPSALRAAQEGLSAGAWLRSLQESGAGIRRQTGLRIYGQARAVVAEYGLEPTRSLDTRPSNTESKPWPTSDKSGVLQTVRLFYVERVTGNVLSRFYTVKSTEGVTRGEAVRRAVEAYSASPPVSAGGSKPTEADFTGAAHVGTAVLTPTGGE